MPDILEIDGSVVTIDGDNIDFDGASEPSRVTQFTALSLAETGPIDSRVTQFALLSVQSPDTIESRVTQFAMISVAANNVDYVRLENPFTLPCFNPCDSYGTFATVIRIGN